MRRSRIENVSAAERLARERAAHNRGVALENGRPVGAVQPESGESGRRAAGAQSSSRRPFEIEVEHRRVLGHADRLFQRQSHDARAETNSRRARRDMREKHKRRGKTAFVPVEVMLGDPGQVEAMTLRLNDLLRREPIPLSRCRLIQKPGEETKPYGSSPRHACRARSGVVERAKGRGVSPRALDRRTDSPAAAIRDSRAASCPRIRAGTGLAAAAREPPCRRNRRGLRARRGT